MPDNPRVERLRHEATTLFDAPALDLLFDAGGETRLVRVLTASAVATPHVVSCQPITLQASETEGAVPTFTADGYPYPVVALGATSPQFYVATHVGPFWVIDAPQEDTVTPCKPKICVAVGGCGLKPLAGASVTITGPGGFTSTTVTDSTGAFCVEVTGGGGTYTITGADTTKMTGQVKTVVVDGALCLTYNVGLAYTAKSGYHCFCACAEPIADTLHLSIGSHTVTLTYGRFAEYPNSWGGCDVWAAVSGVLTSACECDYHIQSGGYPDVNDLPIAFILAGPLETSVAGCKLFLAYPATTGYNASGTIATIPVTAACAVSALAEWYQEYLCGTAPNQYTCRRRAVANLCAFCIGDVVAGCTGFSFDFCTNHGLGGSTCNPWVFDYHTAGAGIIKLVDMYYTPSFGAFLTHVLVQEAGPLTITE